jgi:beta-galactosidase
MTNCYRLAIGMFSLAWLFSSISMSQIASLPATFELRSIGGITVPYQYGSPLPTFEKQPRPTIDLKGFWLKQRFSANHVVTMGKRDSAGYAALVAEAAGRFLQSFNDAGWTAKNLPAVENALNGLDVRPEDYEDGVWYRRSFTVADSLKFRLARLNFLAVNYVADVWLNGRYLGYHEGGYTPFSFDVTGIVRTDTVNVLAVRVDNPAWGSRNDIVPYGNLSHKPDWFNFTGIIHDVFLEFPPTFSIVRAEAIPQSLNGDVQVTIVVSNKSGMSKDARVIVTAHAANVTPANIQSEYSSELLGSVVASQATAVSTYPSDSVVVHRSVLTIPSPKAWSPKHPDLYILRALLVVGSDTIEQYCTQFGIRTLSMQGSTLLLNGKPMFFPGVARHEDHYLYGRSVPVPVIYSDLQKVADLNATFLRTAHYPNHPYTYLAADRLGIAVLEEIPVWWFDESDAWLKQDFFRHIHDQMWREMVFRDRNRPSILFWSTCNECLDQTNRGNFINRLNTELDAQYPDGRFVTESAAADRPGPTDPTQAVCDVAGWTMYFGIFHGSTYYAGTKDFLQKAIASYPAKPFVDTEFGYWSREDLATSSVQRTVFDSTFSAFNEFVTVDSNGIYRPGKPLCATTWWCVFDWYSIQTGNQTMGLYKMDHVTAKSVAGRLRDVYRPFKASSETSVLSVADNSSLVPSSFALDQNYPNPFNPGTTIGFRIPGENIGSGVWGLGSRWVRLVVYDVLGREVAVLVDGEKAPGAHTVEFNAAGLGTGMYFYRLVAGTFSEAKTMLVVK